MTEDVLTEQDLAVAALERPQVGLGCGQDDPVFSELTQLRGGQEEASLAETPDDARHERVVLATETDDDVVQSTEAFACLRSHAAAQER